MARVEAYKKHCDRLKSEILSNCPILPDVATLIYDYTCPTEIEHYVQVIATGRVCGSWQNDRCEYSVTLKMLNDEFIHFGGPHRDVYHVELIDKLFMFGGVDGVGPSAHIPNIIESLLLHSGLILGCANHVRGEVCELVNGATAAITGPIAARIHENIIQSFTNAADTL